MLGTLAKVFGEFAKVSRKLAIMNHYCYMHIQLVKGHHLLPPGGPAGDGYRTCTFPFTGSSRASEGEASSQPNTMVLKRILGHAAGIA